MRPPVIRFVILGHKLRDSFTWNRNETCLNPAEFAKILCDDLELPPTHFVQAITQSIENQLEDHPKEELFEGSTDQRVIIKLNIHVGNISLNDQVHIFWSFSNFFRQVLLVEIFFWFFEKFFFSNYFLVFWEIFFFKLFSGFLRNFFFKFFSGFLRNFFFKLFSGFLRNFFSNVFLFFFGGYFCLFQTFSVFLRIFLQTFFCFLADIFFLIKHFLFFTNIFLFWGIFDTWFHYFLDWVGYVRVPKYSWVFRFRALPRFGIGRRVCYRDRVFYQRATFLAPKNILIYWSTIAHHQTGT